MKFLVDECVDFLLVEWLRNQNLDVRAVAEEISGMRDTDVLTVALAEKRILITNDKGFSDMIFVEKKQHAGVILLRMQDESFEQVTKIFNELLKNYQNQISNNFIVLTKLSIRGVQKIDA